MTHSITVDDLLQHATNIAVTKLREPTHPPPENFANFVRQDILDTSYFRSNRMRDVSFNEIKTILENLSGTGARTHINLSALGQITLNDIQSEGSKLGKRLGLSATEVVPSVSKENFIDSIRERVDANELAEFERKLPENIVNENDINAAINAAFGSDYYGVLDDIAEETEEIMAKILSKNEAAPQQQNTGTVSKSAPNTIEGTGHHNHDLV